MIKKEIRYVVRCNSCETELYAATTEAGAEEFQDARRNAKGELLCLYDVCRDVREKELLLGKREDPKLKETNK